jgi:hypothetical protein
MRELYVHRTRGEFHWIGEIDDTLHTFHLENPSAAHFYAAVVNPKGKRGVYQLTARWNDGRYYSPVECQAIAVMEYWEHKPIVTPLFPGDLTRAIDWRPGPGGFPKINWLGDIQLSSEGGRVFVDSPSSNLDLVISAPVPGSIEARLYDMNEVMIGEIAEDNIDVISRSSAGVFPRAHLTNTRLSPSNRYVLQIIPKSDTSSGGTKMLIVVR